jgi:hypothetical protein
MSKTPTLATCKKLHELFPEWETEKVYFDGTIYYREDRHVRNWSGVKSARLVEPRTAVVAPDTDELLEKLPNDVIIKKTEDGDYRVYAPKTVPIESLVSDTPPEALALLLIRLREEKIL